MNNEDTCLNCMHKSVCKYTKDYGELKKSLDELLEKESQWSPFSVTVQCTSKAIHNPGLTYPPNMRSADIQQQIPTPSTIDRNGSSNGGVMLLQEHTNDPAKQVVDVSKLAKAHGTTPDGVPANTSEIDYTKVQTKSRSRKIAQ